MEKNRLMEIAEAAAKTAKRHGASDARIKMTNDRYVFLKRSESVLAQSEESASKTLSLSLFVDGRWSAHATKDFRAKPLEEFIKNAVAMTRYLTEDPHRKLPPAELYQAYEEKPLQLVDKRYDDTGMAWRKELALRLEQEAKTGGENIIEIETGYWDSIHEEALFNTNGFSATHDGTNYGFYSGIIMQDEGNARVTEWGYASARHRQDIPAAEAIAEKTIERIRRKLGAKPMKTAKLPMILENKNAARLMGMLIEPMHGSAIQQKRSFLEGMKGKPIASDILTITDDPFLPKGLGSKLYDSEGIPTKRRKLIEKGVLNDYLLDVYYASKLGLEPTGASTTNLTFPQGEKDIKALMKEAGRGIVVMGFLGGNANSATGDFSRGIYGYYFDNGEFAKPIKEMNIADNQKDFWKKLVAFGNDPYPYNKTKSPSLLFEDIQFSGLG